MPETGNTEQSMKVAESIATAVLDKVLTRHPELKTGQTPGDLILKWMPLVVAVGTAFWTLAIQSKQVDENSSDIAKLEARYDQTQVIMQSVDSRLARIETTLDIVTGGKQGAQASGHAR